MAGSMVDVVRRRSERSRARAAERHQPLGIVAARYASMGWPVCPGAHRYRGPRASKETGRACSCDRVGCPAPGAHPVSPTWQMQATVDIDVIANWWAARPEANVILVTGRVFDVLDAPAAAGSAALARMEAVGAAVGPVSSLGPDRGVHPTWGHPARAGEQLLTSIGHAQASQASTRYSSNRSASGSGCSPGERSQRADRPSA